MGQKFYTPRRLLQTSGPFADQTVTQRNFDLIANGMAALFEAVQSGFQPIPPTPTPSGATGFSATYTFGPNSYIDSTGAEVNQNSFQIVEDFTKFGPTVTAELSCQSLSASGTGTFRIRVGGTSNALDGLVILTLAQPLATLSKTPGASGSFPNPGGVQQFIKLTIQSSGATHKAQIQNMVLTLKG